MAIAKEEIKRLTEKLYFSKMRILVRNGFFGYLLLHTAFALRDSPELRTKGVSTDGKTIYFHPDCLREYSDDELDFLILHELLHVALRHCFRGKGLDRKRFDVACDIVVNSNLLQNGNLLIEADLPHLTPDGREGNLFSAEEVYAMLPEDLDVGDRGTDSHEMWPGEESNEFEEDARDQMVLRAYEVATLRKASGFAPKSIKRMVKALREPQIDWRVYLQNFIQEEIVDYSFYPPDRRFADGDFLLPDFNEKDEEVRNVLFMVDTSGSMETKDIEACYSEIKGAIEQFNGKLAGFLGFFDVKVSKVVEFGFAEDIKRITPIGGGGTNYQSIFDYIEMHMADNPPSSLIILTDGDAPYPDVAETMGIPILWVITDKESVPPYGKVARIRT